MPKPDGDDEPAGSRRVMTGEVGQVRFNLEPRAQQRRLPRWDRLFYISRRLPAAIEAFSHDLAVEPGQRLLDYGCADVPYRSLFPAAIDYVAADIVGNDAATLELREDGSVPLEDDSVDAILSTQVLEHVLDPALYLDEVARVLRPSGRALISTHGIMVYHPDPKDLWRWTCEGLQHAVAEAGLEVNRFEGVMGLGATGVQLAQDALYYRLPNRLRPVLGLIAQSLIAAVDRLESDESRKYNALVFAMIAEKPR